MRCGSGSAAKDLQHADVTSPSTSRDTPIASRVVTRPRKPVSPAPLRAIVPRVRPYAGTLAFCAVCLVIAAGVGLAFPVVVRYLLDAAFQQRDRALLDRIAIGMILAFALQGLMNFVQVNLLTSTSERVVARLREDVFAHLVRLSPGFFTEQRTGELTSRLSADLAVLQTLLATWISEASRQVLFLVGGVLLLTLTNPQLTTTTLGVVPIVVGVAFFFGRRLRKASTGLQDRVAQSLGMANEAFAQIRTVQSFVREEEETRRYGSLLSGVVDVAVARAKMRATLFGIVSFLLLAITVAAAVGSLVSLFGSYQEAVGAAQRVFELLALQPTVAEPVHPVPLRKPVRGAVGLEHVRFRYAPELHEVLTDVTFTIAPGEVVALVGPSGAGKTTVASLIPRFWDVTGGRITLDGVDIRDLAFVDLRGAIGMVPQEPALFSGTVRENIAYARPDASDA